MTAVKPKASDLLEFAEANPRKHLSVLLYGPEGCGKSVAAVSAPGPMVYVNADRPGATRFARRKFPDKGILELPVNLERGWAPMEHLFLALRDGELADVETVVIDSLGRLYDVCLADLAKDDKHPTLPERGDANTKIERYILALLEFPINVVLVAHDNPVKVSGNEEQGTDVLELFPFTGTGNPNLAKKIMRALDIVAYCGRRPIPDDTEPADSVAVDKERRYEYMAQLFAAGGRRAKETTGVLGDAELLDLSDWAERITTAYSDIPNAKTNQKERTA